MFLLCSYRRKSVNIGLFMILILFILLSACITYVPIGNMQQNNTSSRDTDGHNDIKFIYSASNGIEDGILQGRLSQLGPVEFPNGNPSDIFHVRESIAIDLWPGIYFPEDVDIYRPLIEDLHAQGIKYLIYRNLFQLTDVNYTRLYEYYPDFTPENVSFIDLDGNPRIVGYDPYGSPIFYLSTDRPYWQSFIINSTKLAIDAGCDAVVYDVGFGHYPPNEQNFDPDSIEGFRTFLANKYTSTELKDKFNIDDITTFDFGQYLRDLGYDASSLKEALDKGQSLGTYADRLWTEWDEFHLTVLVNFYKELYTELKAYAKSKGKEFYIFANIYDSLHTSRNILYLIQYVDGIFAEIFFDDWNYPTWTPATAYRTVYSLGKHYIPMTSPNASTDLYPLYIGELFSCGGWLVSTNYTDYFSFINKHQELFGREQDGEIGLVYSLASSENYTSFDGAYHLLSNIHRSFDIIVFGDNKWFNDNLTLDYLRKYKAIVLPSTSYLTDTQVELLLNYTKLGGVLIGIGDVGKYNETGGTVTSSTRQEFISLFNGSLNEYGNGKVFSWTENIALQYYTNRNTTILTDFRDELESIISPEITTDFNTNVTIIQYWDTQRESMLLHFINYNYNSTSETISPQGSHIFTFTLRPELQGKTLEILYYTPDAYPNGTELTYTTETDGRITVTIPDLNIWGILKVRPKDSVQQDMIISSPTTFKDTVLVINGNLIINSQLTLENVVLKINSSIDKTFYIEINDGGELIIENSKITAYNPNYHYYINAKPGSKLIIISSEISHAGVWGTIPMGGIWIETNDIVIANSTIHDNYDYGIYLFNVSHVLIANCTFFNNNIGIYLHNTSYATISDSTFYNNSVGVYEKWTYHARIEYSHIYNNKYWGISIWNSLFPLINSSTVRSNGLDGVIIWNSVFAKIYESEFFDNENGINVRSSPIITVSTSSSYNNSNAGLLLYEVELTYDNNIFGVIEALGTIVSSEFYNNTYGIYMDNSEHTKISNTGLYNNTYGLFISGPTIYTFVCLSNFIDNDNQIYLSPEAQGKVQFDNMTHGNYWSNYSGQDSDDDGIIDEPYTIDAADKDYHPLVSPVTITKIFDIYNPHITNITVERTDNQDNYTLTITVYVEDDTSLSWILMNGTLYNLGGDYPKMFIWVYFYEPPVANYKLLPEEGYPLKETSATVQVTLPSNYSGKFRIFAVDVYGNWAENDSTAPRILHILSKPQNPTYCSDVKISVFAEDQSGLSKGILSYNNGTKWYNTTMTRNKETGAFEGHISKQLHNTTITYKVYVEDLLGNKGSSKTYQYTVLDEIPPSIKIITPSNGSTLTNTVNITWEARDNESGLDMFEIYLNNSLKTKLDAEVLTAYEFTISDLENGTYKLKIIAKDRAGNQASDTIWFTFYAYAEEEPSEGEQEPQQFDMTYFLLGGAVIGVAIILTIAILKRRRK